MDHLPLWLREIIRRWLNRSPDRCSANLTMWAIGLRDWQDGFDAESCKDAARLCGYCWCGKFCTEAMRQYTKQIAVEEKESA